jgi:hypothetical protein
MEFENQYLNYSEYVALGGELSEMPFNILEFKAQNEVDKDTFGRLKELDGQLQDTKMCIFDLIQILNKNEQISKNQSKGIASENTDGYSVIYNQASTDAVKSKEAEIRDCVRSYLIDCVLEDGTPYMYCGV